MSRSVTGTTDKIDFGTGVAKASSNISGYCWIYPTVNNSSNRNLTMFTLGPQTGDTNTNFVFLLNQYVPSTPNSVGVAINDGSWKEAFSTSPYTANVWQHVGFTFNGSNVRFFINGAFINTVSASWTLATGGTQSFRIGSRRDDGNELDGRIAYVGYHTALLTDGEMMHAYTNRFVFGRSAQLLAPLGWNSPEPEYSGNKHSGTVTGATMANAPPFRNPFGWSDDDPYVVSAGGGGGGTTHHLHLPLLGVG